MHVHRLSVLGLGLLGGSIAMAARDRIIGCKIVGYAHRRETLQIAQDQGSIDEGYDDPLAAVRGADLVVVCTPVSLIGPLLERISPALAVGAMVTDVGSTKRSIVEAGERAGGGRIQFVGSHPMAGSEKKGLQHARADLFDGALCITTPTAKTDPAALQTVEAFWQTLGMRTLRVSPADHDRLLADVSHLPHAVAAALVAMQDPQALGLCGKGFQDMTRIAGGDGALWRDILLDNRDQVRASLRRLIETLASLERMLEPDRSQELRSWLDQAAARRRQISDSQAIALQRSCRKLKETTESTESREDREKK